MRMAQIILYSYRRCPYAMRARMALQYAGIVFEIREISLRNKPQEMIAFSPKATVPVLVLPDKTVIDESLGIMFWALNQQDTDGWLDVNLAEAKDLIKTNDGWFKNALDAYKYADRYPEKTIAEHRAAGEVFLEQLERRLEQHNRLCGQRLTVADIAIFPFIRQFKGVDSDWFDNAPYVNVNQWLTSLIQSDLFDSIMKKHPTYLA